MALDRKAETKKSRIHQILLGTKANSVVATTHTWNRLPEKNVHFIQLSSLSSAKENNNGIILI